MKTYFKLGLLILLNSTILSRADTSNETSSIDTQSICSNKLEICEKEDVESKESILTLRKTIELLQNLYDAEHLKVEEIISGGRITYHNKTATYEVILCEEKKTDILCPAGSVIEVTSGMYGRTDKNTCVHPHMARTDCVCPKTMQKVSKICNNLRTCNLFATNSLYGNECPKTYKYLKVNYQCIDQRPETEVSNIIE